jgi:hypothetical protein
VPTTNVRRAQKLCSVLLLSSAAVCSTRLARADVSSWFYAGGGAAAFDPHAAGDSASGLMQLETGMGTAPNHPLIVGGLLKTMTFFGRGTDLALVARAASRGFVAGSWGLAVDAGGFERWWGPVWSEGGIGALVLGAPLGIQATVFGEIGTGDMRAFGMTIGIDLLRMTVHRSTGLEHWQNPNRLGALPPVSLAF